MVMAKEMWYLCVVSLQYVSTLNIFLRRYSPNDANLMGLKGKQSDLQTLASYRDLHKICRDLKVVVGSAGVIQSEKGT